MVDDLRRKQLAEELRHFVAGQMTNDEFEDKVFEITNGSEDAALFEICQAAWGLYDDMHEHRLQGRYAIRKDGRHDVARWVAFLYSDLEYEWPPNRISWISRISGLTAWLGLLLGACVYVIFTMYFGMSLAFCFPHPYAVWIGCCAGALSFISAGLIVIYISQKYAIYRLERQKQKMRRYGNPDIWPFIRDEDFERIKGQQELL